MVELVNAGHFSAIGPAVKQIKKEHPGDYSEALWGTENSCYIGNLGLVIGYRDATKRQSFRVEYDLRGGKGLHINWEQDVMPVSGAHALIKERYMVSSPLRRPEDEIHAWWRSRTLHHCNELPEPVRDRMGGKHVWHGTHWT